MGALVDELDEELDEVLVETETHEKLGLFVSAPIYCGAYIKILCREFLIAFCTEIKAGTLCLLFCNMLFREFTFAM